MATVKQIKAVTRSRSGKGAARAERRAGRVPGVIYGDGKPPLNNESSRATSSSIR
jgi:large subunit ribosomal protein L25